MFPFPAVFPRLASILDQLPVSTTARALSVGCGAYHAVYTLCDQFPGWTYVGLDRDHGALQTAQRIINGVRGVQLVQGDALALPGLLHTRFGLILVRHPDLFLHLADWHTIMHRLPALAVWPMAA